MNKTISLVLLVSGIVILFLGIQEMNVISSDVSRFFTGSATDKAILLLVAGVVCSSIGLVGLLSAVKKS